MCHSVRLYKCYDVSYNIIPGLRKQHPHNPGLTQIDSIIQTVSIAKNIYTIFIEIRYTTKHKRLKKFLKLTAVWPLM